MATHSEVEDRQRPLRRLYREQPAEALSAKFARTANRHPVEDLFHGEVEVGDGYGVTFRYGIDRKVGGLQDLPNPGDMLLAALAACLDSTIRMIADLLAVDLEELSVEVRGDVDLRGTLMLDGDVPVGFRHISCGIHLTAAAGTDPDLVTTLLELAERCCVTLQSLRAGVAVDVDVREVSPPKEPGPHLPKCSMMKT